MKVRRITDIDIPELGQKIKQARKKDPRSVTDICSQVGMTTSNWYRIETEKTETLPEDTLKKIEEVLGVDFGVRFDDLIVDDKTSSQSNKSEVKKLISQLEFALASSPELDEKRKKKLLKRVQALVDATNNPADEELLERAEDAMAFLKDNFSATEAGLSVGKDIFSVIAQFLRL